jgi:imidazolonepropionase-like amidohydrolase
MSLVLIGGKIVTPFRIIEKGTIVIEDGKIYELGKSTNPGAINLSLISITSL